MPVLNAAAFVRRSLESVFSQTLQDWELICVDNGSTDATESKLREAAATNKRVRILSETIPGAGPARNSGLLAARGTFVAFLDADDQFATPETLAKLVRSATHSGVKISGGSLRVQLSNGEAVEDFGDLNRPFRFEKTEILTYRDYQFDYGFYRFIYNREFLINANITFPHYKRFQDPPFFVNAMMASGTFSALKDETYIHFLGHQLVKWNDEAVHGLLCGLTDNLRTSRIAGLEKLHRLTAERFLFEYASTIQGGCGEGKPRVLSRCLSAIDPGMLHSRQKTALLDYYRQLRGTRC